MQKVLLRSLAVGVAFVFAFGVVPATVLAQGGNPGRGVGEANIQSNGSERAEELKQRLETLRQERQELKQQRLDESKLRVCEKRKSSITNIMNRSITRAERQLQLFDVIAERVKGFYVDKGYSLDNYDELVAAVDDAKANTEANLGTLQGLEPFDCELEDPKGNVEAFKLATQSINNDLKEYRTTVKDLIVGVKSAQSTAAGDSQEGGDE